MVERWWTRDGAVGDMLGRYLRRQHTWCISCPGLVNGLGSVTPQRSPDSRIPRAKRDSSFQIPGEYWGVAPSSSLIYF
jgi:hypothetical protein